jgi:hypothetical protein
VAQVVSGDSPAEAQARRVLQDRIERRIRDEDRRELPFDGHQ